MKKTIILFTMIFLTFTLSACSREKESENYIENANLSKEEEKLAELLGDIDEYEIYDFIIDGDIKTVQINSNELKDGKWEFLSGELTQFKDRTGRIALSFENMGKGSRISIQSENTSGFSSYNTGLMEEMNEENTMSSSSYLSGREKVIYEKEIPLLIQVLTSKESLANYGIDSFFTPEVYEGENYEHVYAMTIMFSEKDIDELTEDKDK